jgi:hypothetical protein
MSVAANIIRAVQLLLVLLLAWDHVASAAAWTWLVSFLLLASGQALNIGVYYRLGNEGVYYGSIFGKRLPRVNAWPYTWLSHPQYTGCILSILGLAHVLPLEVSESSSAFVADRLECHMYLSVSITNLCRSRCFGLSFTCTASYLNRQLLDQSRSDVCKIS